MPVHLLALAAHRDDVELTCAGALIKARDAGYNTGIIDLTAGESGTRGSAELRAEEACRAAEVLGVSERLNAGLPDAYLQNTDETRRVVVEMIRHFAPRVVILPSPSVATPTTGSPLSWAGTHASSRDWPATRLAARRTDRTRSSMPWRTGRTR